VTPPLHDVPGSLAAWGDQCAIVNATMTNAGTTTWTKAGTPGASTYQGRYRVYNPDGTLRVNAVVDMITSVPPGQGAQFPGPWLCAPDSSGSYPFYFDVLRDGAPLSPPLMSTLVVRNTAAVGAIAGPLPVPDQTTCEGFHSPLTVRLTNTGNRRWEAGYCLREVHNGLWNIHPPTGGVDPEPFCLGGPVGVGGSVDLPAGFVAYRHCVWPYFSPTGPSRFNFQLAFWNRVGIAIGASPFQTLGSMERFALPLSTISNPDTQFSFRYWNGSGWSLMWRDTQDNVWRGPNDAFANDGRIRPGDGTPVAFFFKAPHTGPLTITDSIYDVDNCGPDVSDGDGVNLLITHRDAVGGLRAVLRGEAGIAKGSGNGPGPLSFTVNAVVNDTIRIIFKPNNNNTCDMTLSNPGVVAGAPSAWGGPTYNNSPAVESGWD
jgi:hypothetical protein